jgi:hypothetical protein
MHGVAPENRVLNNAPESSDDMPDRSQRIADEPRLLLRPKSSTEPAAPRPAEAAGKTEQDEHTAARIVPKAPKTKNLYLTLSLSGSAVQQAIPPDAN